MTLDWEADRGDTAALGDADGTMADDDCES